MGAGKVCQEKAASNREIRKKSKNYSRFLTIYDQGYERKQFKGVSE